MESGLEFQQLNASLLNFQQQNNSPQYEFNNGCPIITSNNTWMGDTVAKYNAGVVVDNYEPITVLAAIETIIQNYSSFAKNAFIAAEELEKTHNPKYTLDVIKNCLVTEYNLNNTG
jgi:hypothetical protein